MQRTHHDVLLSGRALEADRGIGEGLRLRVPQKLRNDLASAKDGVGKWLVLLRITGAPGEIRTPDLLVRSQALYPTELRARRFGKRKRDGGRY